MTWRASERSAFESKPAGPVPDLEAGPALPLLQDLHRLICRVVDDHHLVLRVVELFEAREQSLDDALLVVGRHVDRHEWVVPEVDVVPVAVAVAVPSAAATDTAQSGGMPVAIRV